MRHRGISSRVAIAIIIVIVIVVLAYLLSQQYVTQPPKPTKVFYVIAYHWGFEFYDSNLNRVERIVVNKGDIVKIYVFPGKAFSGEMHHELEELTVESGIGEYPPGSMEIEELLEEADEAGLLDHGLAIMEFNVNIITDYEAFTGEAASLEEFLEVEAVDATERHSITFTADKVGSFNIICSLYCGYGHEYMVAEGGLIVQE